MELIVSRYSNENRGKIISTHVSNNALRSNFSGKASLQLLKFEKREDPIQNCFKAKKKKKRGGGIQDA